MRGEISVSARILCRDQGRSKSRNFHFIIFSFLCVLIGSISNLPLPNSQKPLFISLNILNRLYILKQTILNSSLCRTDSIVCFSINYCLWQLIPYVFWRVGIFTVNSWSYNFICGNYLRYRFKLCSSRKISLSFYQEPRALPTKTTFK